MKPRTAEPTGHGPLLGEGGAKRKHGRRFGDVKGGKAARRQTAHARDQSASGRQSPMAECGRIGDRLSEDIG